MVVSAFSFGPGLFRSTYNGTAEGYCGCRRRTAAVGSKHRPASGTGNDKNSDQSAMAFFLLDIRLRNKSGCRFRLETRSDLNPIWTYDRVGMKDSGFCNAIISCHHADHADIVGKV